MNNRGILSLLAEDQEPPEGWDPTGVEREDFHRVRFSLMTAVVCEAIPRRLGREAEAAALALDKRVARKVANTYRVTWLSYARLTRGEVEPAPGWSSRTERLGLARDATPEERTAGATVRWGDWIRERLDELDERRRLVAAYALGAGLLKWGGRRVAVLRSERENVERIAHETAIQIRRNRDNRGPGEAAA